MPSEWMRAIDEYEYTVSLDCYKNACDYPGFFRFSKPFNDRYSTIAFESYFRERAGDYCEVWLEAVFWKMFSHPKRRNTLTNRVARYLMNNNVSSQYLLTLCNAYIHHTSRENLAAICSAVGFGSGAIGIAATFPALLRPDRLPVVDTWVAHWVGQHMDDHNNADSRGPQLVRPSRYLDARRTVLTLADFSFVKSWYRWCQHKAVQLSSLTSMDWRPRDVEMAVFSAFNKSIKLGVLDVEVTRD